MKENLLKNKNICITGALKKLTRKQAFNKIMAKGGNPINHLNQNTDILIITDEAMKIDFWTDKKEKYLKFKEKGIDIKVMTENCFYKHISLKNT